MNIGSGIDFDSVTEYFDPSLHPILKRFQQATFGPLLEPNSVPKLVTLDIELKEEYLSSSVRSKPYLAHHIDAMEREKQAEVHDKCNGMSLR